MQRWAYYGHRLLLQLLLLSSVCSATTSPAVAREAVGDASELQNPPISTKETVLSRYADESAKSHKGGVAINENYPIGSGTKGRASGSFRP